MKIHISKNGQQFGPCDEEQLTEKIVQGSVAYDDLAWVEGMSEWLPLRQITSGSTEVPPPIPQPLPSVVPTPSQFAKSEGRSNVADAFSRFLTSYKGEVSESIWTGKNISKKILGIHEAGHLRLAPNESPLIVLNKKAWYQFGGFGWSGLVITNQAVHYCALKKSFFASLVPIKAKGVMPFDKIKSIEIAEHDACFGTAYVGHELRINDAILGYVRMGTGIEFDGEAILFLNAFFDHLAEEGLLERPVKEYAWQ